MKIVGEINQLPVKNCLAKFAEMEGNDDDEVYSDGLYVKKGAGESETYREERPQTKMKMTIFEVIKKHLFKSCLVKFAEFEEKKDVASKRLYVKKGRPVRITGRSRRI